MSAIARSLPYVFIVLNPKSNSDQTKVFPFGELISKIGAQLYWSSNNLKFFWWLDTNDQIWSSVRINTNYAMGECGVGNTLYSLDCIHPFLTFYFRADNRTRTRSRSVLDGTSFSNTSRVQIYYLLIVHVSDVTYDSISFCEIKLLGWDSKCDCYHRSFFLSFWTILNTGDFSIFWNKLS